MTGPFLRLLGLEKRFPGGTVAVDRVDLDVREGELIALLGPSGCGKTTTLRCIAGFEDPTAGTIELAGRRIDQLPANRRGATMVFQGYALFPHLSVFENTAFPLQVGDRKYSRTQIRENVMRVLTAVQLDELADRDATKLSGGQQQRLALARALVMEPALLLLDEPLSNLDAKLRDRMRFELKRLQRELKITTVYVTHDQGEALALSHEIAVMDHGRIHQIGRPRDIYEHPSNQFVADFVGNTNFLDGTVIRHDAQGRCVVRTDIGEIAVQAARPLSPDQRLAISVRPEDVELSESRMGGDNVWQGTVEQKVFLGEAIDFRVSAGSRSLLSRQHPTLRTPIGGVIYIHINPEKCVVFST